ncbi:coiled-coil domain-containing protein [Enterococcus sp. 5H]|uniref:coiled-coil domain-containing protein n=1 Tax=Enterococcus sp. 5H TaxID=1229490 RepID=UPI0023024249|nr:C40 family peptidase [Enterococcus sp. 5H]MDA9471296.1 Protein P54 precursor [Enterococcus sp. 5H]
MKKSVLPLLMICTLALTSVSLPSVVSADEVDSKIQQKDQAISGLKSQEADAQSQVTTVQNQVASINEKAQTLLTQQGELRKTSTNLENEISQLKTRIEKREVAIQNQARDVQVNGNSTSYMDAVLNAKSVSDAITRVTAMSTIVKANNDLVKQQQEDKEAVEDKKAENETKLQELQENQVTLEAQKGDLVKAEADLKVLQTTLAAERATAEDQKAGLVQEKEAAEAERARIAEQEKVVADNAKKAAAEAAAEKAAESTTTATEQSTTQSTDQSSSTSNSNNGTGGSTGGSTGGNTGGNTGGGGIVTPEPEPTPPPTGQGAIAVAAAQVGKPYVWGAKGPSSFDCSGLVYYSFLHGTGRNVGGYTVAQESAGTRISVGEAQAGDLYFWGAPGASYHVAIATGGGGYIHAGNESTGVEYSNVGSFTPSFAVRM